MRELTQKFRARLLFAFVVLLLTNSALAQTSSKPWPETFFQSLLGRSDELKVRVANALFEGSVETDLFTDDFSKNSSLGVNVRRDVYNNYDLLNTWTVIDRLRIRTSAQILGFGDARNNYAPPVNASQFNFMGISFGVNGVLEWRDVKQLVPSEVAKLDSLECKKTAIEGSLGFIRPYEDSITEASPSPTPDPTASDIQELNPYLNSLDLDSSIGIKLHNILNPFTLPFRMPLSRRDLRKLTNGEIISYNVSGQVGFGGSIGLEVMPTSPLHVGASVSVETHLSGEFEVSVQRESERYAKVRISKRKGRGNGARLSLGGEWVNFYDGFFLFKNSSIETRVGQINVKLIPFYISEVQQKDHQIDIAYRYDLDSAEGRDAFHKAVLGSLVLSDSIAKEGITNLNPSVSKLYERKSSLTTSVRTLGSDFGFIFNSSRTLGRSALDTEITDANGTKEIYRNVTEKGKERHNWKGGNEKTIKRLSVMIDLTGFQNQVDNSLLLIAENIVDDSATKASELNRCTSEIMSFFKDPTLFPEVPSNTPPDENGNSRRAWYGRSSFYYGFTFHEAEINNFLHLDLNALESLAAALQVNFDADSYLSAREAFDQRAPTELRAALENLFSNRRKTAQWMELLMLTDTLKSRESFLVAQNAVFGNIQNRGHQISGLEKTLLNTEREMGLGSDTYRTVNDPDAVVTNLEAKINTQNLVEITFTLANDPAYLYFHLNPLNTRESRKDAVELIIFNRDQRFHKGSNTLILDPSNSDALILRLTQTLDFDELVLFTLGYSQKSSDWGYGASTKFVTPDRYRR